MTRLARRLSPLLAVLPLLLLLDACQTPTASGTAPATALQTFDALYANAVAADDLVLKGTTTALQSGLISSEQAKRILVIADSVKAALDLANSAAQAGNTALASGNLAQAVGPLAILSACLTTKPLTVTTFEKCASSLSVAQVQS